MNCHFKGSFMTTYDDLKELEKKISDGSFLENL